MRKGERDMKSWYASNHTSSKRHVQVLCNHDGENRKNIHNIKRHEAWYVHVWWHSICVQNKHPPYKKACNVASSKYKGMDKHNKASRMRKNHASEEMSNWKSELGFPSRVISSCDHVATGVRRTREPTHTPIKSWQSGAFEENSTRKHWMRRKRKIRQWSRHLVY